MHQCGLGLKPNEVMSSSKPANQAKEAQAETEWNRSINILCPGVLDP